MNMSEFLKLAKAELSVSRTAEQIRLNAELGDPSESLGLVRYDSREKAYRAKAERKLLWFKHKSSWERLMTASPEQAAFYGRLLRLSETASILYLVGVAGLFAVAAPFVSIDGLVPSSFISKELYLLMPGISVFVFSLSARKAFADRKLGPLPKA